MARTLQELQKQYNSSSKNGMGGMGKGPGRGPGAKNIGGKPKNTKKTIGRLLGYVGKYKFLLLVVFLFMMINTTFSLVGGYMTRPIINRLAAYSFNYNQEYGAVDTAQEIAVSNDPTSGFIYNVADKAIEGYKNVASPFIGKIIKSDNQAVADILSYIGAASNQCQAS